MSFKPSSQTAENVHEEDDKAGKQCQREHVNFSVVSIALGGWNSLSKDLCKFGHLCNEMLFLE